MLLTYLVLTAVLTKAHKPSPIYIESPVLIDFRHMKPEGGGDVIQGRKPVAVNNEPIESSEVVPSVTDLPQSVVNDTRRRVRKSNDQFKRLEVSEWSRCQDFVSVGRFDSTQLVGATWLPFFVWSKYNAAIFNSVNFSMPTKQLLSHYIHNYKPLSNIDWRPSKLVMRAEPDEFLLIAADTHGLFNVIRKIEDSDLKDIRSGRHMLPRMQFRLRLIRQYLLLINCLQPLAIALAPADAVPSDRSAREAAAGEIGFKGSGVAVEET